MDIAGADGGGPGHAVWSADAAAVNGADADGRPGRDAPGPMSTVACGRFWTATTTSPTSYPVRTEHDKAAHHHLRPIGRCVCCITTVPRTQQTRCSTTATNQSTRMSDGRRRIEWTSALVALALTAGHGSPARASIEGQKYFDDTAPFALHDKSRTTSPRRRRISRQIPPQTSRSRPPGALARSDLHMVLTPYWPTRPADGVSLPWAGPLPRAGSHQRNGPVGEVRVYFTGICCRGQWALTTPYPDCRSRWCRRRAS
jgi:hypothetical protein